MGDKVRRWEVQKCGYTMNIVPLELKNLNEAEIFKSEIRNWKPKQFKAISICPDLPYIQNVGYVNSNVY